MATATLTFTLAPDNRSAIHHDGKRIIVTGTVAIQASPATYVTNGIPIPQALGLELIKTIKQPNYMLFWSTTTAGTNVYVFDITNNTLRIYVLSGGAYSEVANGATIPAGVSGDTIDFVAQFLSLI